MITIEERIKGIDASESTGERKSILYRGDNMPRDVKRIPLRYLLYNPHNGRIRSYTKSYEAQFHDLDPKKDEDKLVIEQYLYDSAKNRNEKTLESLDRNGQQEVGIVTKDGIIIDGNRRAMLLNLLCQRNNVEGFFNAIILPDKLSENEKEIVTLETSYQMGVDSKVDYNPIEKYIRCKELNERHGLSHLEIANIMAEEEPRIGEWLSILKIMDQYLEYLGSPGVYTRLEKKEGHFVDLHTYLKSYNKKPTSVNWDYSDYDLDNLKKTYFDYIRLGIPVLRARVIAKPSSSFFSDKEIWDEFYQENQKVINSYNAPNFREVKESDPQKTNEDIIRNLDSMWKQEVGDFLLDDLSYSESLLKDKVEQLAPVKLLKRVINNLGQIDYEALLKSEKGEIQMLLRNIELKIDSFKVFLFNREDY